MDHPRACGEQGNRYRQRHDCLGSSPRVRGAALVGMSNRIQSWIIPARAGSRPVPLIWPVKVWDHPRACGEQDDADMEARTSEGSSPRVRGAGKSSCCSAPITRIIPARAGSSWAICACCRFFWDHPRVCGEQSPAHSMSPPDRGSSPRVRGAGSRTSYSEKTVGIIPACAGSRRRHDGGPVGRRDHPRACGEQPYHCPPAFVEPGSSPRVRGAVLGITVDDSYAGIIPARAGSRLKNPQLKTPYPFDVGPILISLLNKLKVASQSDSAR